MPKDEKQPPKEQIKVTDKRIFTADGDLREEFRDQIQPSEPSFAPAEAPREETAAPAEKKPFVEKRVRDEGNPAGHDRRRTLADRAANPGTPFSNFIEPLIAQAYMSLGMLRNPYQPQPTVDAASARQMIDIIQLLHEKTAGNLTPEEEDFLDAHMGELKLAYVQRTKNI
ncbi:MAG: DUF1844 domain-containing protein [Acidobacteria bacterium]|nr:DUF1844 domain-containing protein [Acidobacteriota bacterium]